MTVAIRIGMYIAAGMLANTVEFITWQPETEQLSVHVGALSELLGAPGMWSGLVGGAAITWWQWAKRNGKAT